MPASITLNASKMLMTYNDGEGVDDHYPTSNISEFAASNSRGISMVVGMIRVVLEFDNENDRDAAIVTLRSIYD
ncbi:MAG: hypothetical protein ACQ5SW_10345 [Sphaerochaetaceae bacterium]